MKDELMDTQSQTSERGLGRQDTGKEDEEEDIACSSIQVEGMKEYPESLPAYEMLRTADKDAKNCDKTER